MQYRVISSVLLLLICSNWMYGAQALDVSEINSLNFLFNTTLPDNPTLWSTTSHPCTWAGVTCQNPNTTATNVTDPNSNMTRESTPSNDQDLHVTKLFIARPAGTGTLPASAISGLRYLRVFQIVSYPGLTGSLPPFTNNPLIYYIDISETNLSGVIPAINARATDPVQQNVTNSQDGIFRLTNNPGINGVSDAAMMDGNLGGFHTIEISGTSGLGNITRIFGIIPTFSIQRILLNNVGLMGSIPTFYESKWNHSLLNTVDLQNNALTINNQTQSSSNVMRGLVLMYSNNPINSTAATLLNMLPGFSILLCSNCSLYGDLPSSPFDKSQYYSALVLSNNGITGSFDGLFHPNASQLLSLSISNNQINVSIPSVNAPLLTSIDMSNNSIPGRAPTFYGNNLITYYAQKNNFTGLPLAIPGSSLQHIDFTDNPITMGPFMNISQQLLFTSIIYNNISWNQSIESFLLSLPISVTNISCMNCSLYGPIPNLSENRTMAYKYINLAQNSISGSYSNFFHPNASQLQFLNMTMNTLNIEVKSLPSSPIQTLLLSTNSIPGYGLNLTNLINITEFTLDTNNLQYPPILNTTSLMNISLSNNPFISVQPMDLFQSLPTTIQSFECSNCSLTFQFPMNSTIFQNFTQFQYLNFSNNKLQNPVILLNTPSSLRSIDLSMNSISSLDGVQSNPSLSALYLSNNLLSTIPNLNTTNITTLYIDGNEIMDWNWISSLPSNISILNLNNNEINQPFPIWFVNNQSSMISSSNITNMTSFNTNTTWMTMIPSLTQFMVRNNKINGTLPNICAVPPLASHFQLLDASMNQLIGSIPSLSSCNALQTYIVATNQLNGNLPSSQDLSTALQNLDISMNQFVGPIPDYRVLNVHAPWKLNISCNTLTPMNTTFFTLPSAVSISYTCYDAGLGTNNQSLCQQLCSLIQPTIPPTLQPNTTLAPNTTVSPNTTMAPTDVPTTSAPTGPTSIPTGPTSIPTGPTSTPTGPTSTPTGPTSTPTGPTTSTPTGPTTSAPTNGTISGGASHGSTMGLSECFIVLIVCFSTWLLN